MRKLRLPLWAATLALACAARAEPGPNPALTDPDKTNWELFIEVTADAKSAGDNNALFETWASDGDTFRTDPAWPTTPSPLSLKPRALSLVERPTSGAVILPELVPGTGHETPEETRRNKKDFDFIVGRDLFKVSGLVKAFNEAQGSGTVLTFPTDSLEVKANWVPVEDLRGFDGFAGTPEEAAKLFHLNTAKDTQTGRSRTYALVSMHVISKLVPNWTWATWEHKDNPGRCDVIGCADGFGAQAPFVAPLSPVESTEPPGHAKHYPDCVKSPALLALFDKATFDPAFRNYCLKGSQTDFTDARGLATRVGNSVTEKGFVAYASCMTCHARAAFDQGGRPTTLAGFDPISINLPPRRNAANAPIGAPNASWFFMPGDPPGLPMLARMQTLTRLALDADFVWSIPFCAIDDTANPPQTKSRCSGK